MTKNLSQIISENGDSSEVLTNAVATLGESFHATTGITVTPDELVKCPALITHVLSGGEYPLDIAVCMEELKTRPSVSNLLVAKEVEAGRIDKIQTATAGMSPTAKMNFARAHNLDKPKKVKDSMTLSEHLTVLEGLSSRNRLNYARKHGLA